MKQTKNFSMMVAILIVAMSVGFTSCSKDKEEPEVDYSFVIMGNWYCTTARGERVASLTFNRDGTYSYNIYGEYSYNIIDQTSVYVPVNEININGLYNIVESKKITMSDTIVSYTNPEGILVEEIETYDATLFKMLASGSSVFDQLWVYFRNTKGQRPESLNVHLYSKNEHVQELWGFGRQNYGVN